MTRQTIICTLEFTTAEMDTVPDARQIQADLASYLTVNGVDGVTPLWLTMAASRNSYTVTARCVSMNTGATEPHDTEPLEQ